MWSLLLLVVLCSASFKPTAQISGFEKYREPCDHNDQCAGADFRLVCHPLEAVCQCARFYYWNEQFRECHLNSTHLNSYFNDHKERHIADELNHDAGMAFMSIALAGIVSLSLGMALAMLCVLYACLFRDVVHHVGLTQKSALTKPSKSVPQQSSAQKTK